MKAGTEDTSGRGQIISNINACQAVVDVVKTTLGKFRVSKNESLKSLLNLVYRDYGTRILIGSV
jgi:hypothetical protein